jgi:hypothetical protein
MCAPSIEAIQARMGHVRRSAAAFGVAALTPSARPAAEVVNRLDGPNRHWPSGRSVLEGVAHTSRHGDARLHWPRTKVDWHVWCPRNCFLRYGSSCSASVQHAAEWRLTRQSGRHKATAATAEVSRTPSSRVFSVVFGCAGVCLTLCHVVVAAMQQSVQCALLRLHACGVPPSQLRRCSAQLLRSTRVLPTSEAFCLGLD